MSLLLLETAAKVACAVGAAAVKQGDRPEISYSLTGRLYLSRSGWILLHVPNALASGAFAALSEPGAELPKDDAGRFEAHVSVMRPEEVATIPGGADSITERGKGVSFNLGPLRTCVPAGWAEMSKVWFFEVRSPELEAIRKSYGLPPQGKHPFHLTIAVRRKSVLRNNDVSKAAAAVAGISDRQDQGDLSKLTPGQLADLAVQLHRANRAGEHRDLRVGTPETGLFSWALRHGIPAPGEKRLAVRQPLHSHEYGDFEGEIPEGYGAGEVSLERKGRLLITAVAPDKIEFTTADQRHPERFVLVRPKTAKPQNWLLINTTPREGLPYKKIRFTKIPAEQVEGELQKMVPGTSVQTKIDGASSLVRLLKNRLEVVSYRTAKATGQPIVHTERMFGGKAPIAPPSELVGSILRGELYGTKAGPEGQEKAIPPQELGGILNATVEHALAAQKERGISLRNALFDIQQLGGRPVDPGQTPYPERRKMLERVLQWLPPGKFHLTEEATTPEAAAELWKQIGSGEHPEGHHEGVVIHPPTGKPVKAKLLDEHDVRVTGVFPGQGKYKGSAGGLVYSLQAGGAPIGRVGTGFDDETRRTLGADPAAVIGRIARVRAQGAFPGGALRAPSFIAFHEDLPAAEPGVLGKLKEIKTLSDAGQYGEKANRLRQMMTDFPGDWLIDNREGKNYGVTHRPTGFRFHLPRKSIPAGVAGT